MLEQWREQTLEGKVLALAEMETNTFLNHETKEAVVVPAAAEAMEVAGGSNWYQESKLKRAREGKRSQRIVNSAKHHSGRP